jgi:hypothetical protein
MLIGIDTGVNTGIAVVDGVNIIHIGTYKILDAMEVVLKYNAPVFIEDPNTFGYSYSKVRGRDQGAGSIKRDFSIWVDFFEKHNIKYTKVNVRSVKDGTDEKLFKKITGYEKRTSKHAREACYMVFGRKI